MGAMGADRIFKSALVASADPEVRRKFSKQLRWACCQVDEAQGGADALEKLESGTWQALFLDSWLPDLEVHEVVHLVQARHPQVKILMLDTKAGAKAAENRNVCGESSVEILPRSIETQPYQGPLPGPESASSPTQQPSDDGLIEPLPGMIGGSEAMNYVYRLSRLVAVRSTTVLLTGETGTGKELVAKGIHLLSLRQRQPFITVNCAAIPESLLEAELFGYARGAFTGAFQSRMGRIHTAHGGTLFLDEVGELPLSMQAKLLRFLQEGEVQRLGSGDTIRVDVRVIAATNAQLTRKVEEKTFREDLYYRISVFPIDLAPLRERPEDILPLGLHFLGLLCSESSVPPKSISSSAARMLSTYTWPGNVRELRHAIERAFILSEDRAEIHSSHINFPSQSRTKVNFISRRVIDPLPA